MWLQARERIANQIVCTPPLRMRHHALESVFQRSGHRFASRKRVKTKSWSMIRKSAQRFSEKIMLNQKAKAR
jgi:hypothetical protein